MRKATFIIFIMLYSGHLYAQQVDKYYHHIYQAESLILAGRYNAAANEYDSASKYKKNPFSSDLYNNIICNIRSGTINLHTYELCQALIIKGADTTFFKKSIFQKLKKTKYWDKIKNSYSDIIKSRQINSKLISIIDTLLYADQLIHCQLQFNSKDIDFIEKMHKNDEDNSKSLLELMKNNDSLSEDVIGGNFQDTNIFIQPKYGPLILHEFQRQGEILRQIIKEAIIAGKIRADVGLSWLEYDGSSHLIYLNDYQMYKGNIYRRDIDTTSLRLISRFVTRLLYITGQDTNGASLKNLFYVDTRKNVENKMMYNYGNYRADFIFWTPIKEITIPQNQYENFKRNKVLIDGDIGYK